MSLLSIRFISWYIIIIILPYNRRLVSCRVPSLHGYMPFTCCSSTTLNLLKMHYTGRMKRALWLYTSRGQGAQLQLVSPSPSETARPAELDRSACGLAPSVSTQFTGVAYTDVVQTDKQTNYRPCTNSNWWTYKNAMCHTIGLIGCILAHSLVRHHQFAFCRQLMTKPDLNGQTLPVAESWYYFLAIPQKMQSNVKWNKFSLFDTIWIMVQVTITTKVTSQACNKSSRRNRSPLIYSDKVDYQRNHLTPSAWEMQYSN